jgi:signal transduction histidine kinase
MSRFFRMISSDMTLKLELIGSSPTLAQVEKWVSELSFPAIEIGHCQDLSGFQTKYPYGHSGIILLSGDLVPANELDWKKLELKFAASSFVVADWDRDSHPYEGLFEVPSIKEISSVLWPLLNHHCYSFPAEQLQNSYAFNAHIIGKIIHGLNNRFLSISGNVQMLNNQIGEHPGMLSVLDELRKNNNTVNDMVQQIRGKNTREFASAFPHDLLSLLKNSLSFWHRNLKDSRVQVHVDMEEIVHVSEQYNEDLWICLGILIQNAAEVMRDSKRRILKIDISSQVYQSVPPSVFGSPALGKFITLRFADTGGGIWCQDPRLIFEPHFSTKGEGHGFALSLVKEFCSRNGRYLDVVTDFESGAAFEIGLPVASLV